MLSEQRLAQAADGDVELELTLLRHQASGALYNAINAACKEETAFF